MQAREGPWRGYRWRRPASGPDDGTDSDDAPAPPSRPPRSPPTATPVPEPPAESAPRPSALHDDETGHPQPPLLHEKHMERLLLVGGILYVLILFDVFYGGMATWIDGRFMGLMTAVPEQVRAVVGVLFSAPGERWLLAAIVLALAVRTWIKGSALSGALVAMSAGTLMLFIDFTKWVVDRPRPTTFIAEPGWIPEWFLPSSASFPSGHATGALFVYGLALVTLWRPPGPGTGLLPMPARIPRPYLALGIVLGFLPGVGRFVWGVHWLSDTIAGWALAVAWLGATILIGNSWRLGTQTRQEAESGEVEPAQSGLGGLYDR